MDGLAFYGPAADRIDATLTSRTRSAGRLADRLLSVASLLDRSASEVEQAQRERERKLEELPAGAGGAEGGGGPEGGALMLARSSGGSVGTIVVDIAGVRSASGVLGDAGQAFSQLASRVRGHALPEMPPGVAEHVAAALAEVASELAGFPQPFVDTAKELRVRAFWAQIADKLIAGQDLEGAELTEFKAAYASGLLTRYAGAGLADLARDYAQEVHDEENPGGIAGFFDDVGDFFEGAWDAIKEPAVMLYHLTPLSEDWTDSWGDLGHGLAYGVTHPLEFGKAILNLDALDERGLAYWLGNLAPAAAATILSGGGAAALRGARGASALSRSTQGAVAAERAAGAARLVTGARDLAKLEVSAGRAGRINYAERFADDLKNFEGGKAWLHEGPLDRDLTLVQYPVGDGAGATAKWWTSTDEGNLAQTMDDVHRRLALLPEWGERTSVRVARIPEGTEVEYLYGRAAPQVAEDGVAYAGHGQQFRFRDFDEQWIRETRQLP